MARIIQTISKATFDPTDPDRGFTPQLTATEAKGFAARYLLQDDEAAFAAGQFIKAGEGNRVHLEIIFRWKNKDRGKGRLCQNSDEEIKDALHLASCAVQPRSGIAVLTGLYGVNVPTASAIMTVIHPDRYTIIDYRALEALGSIVTDRSIPYYLHYLACCSGLAKLWGMSLRELDRGLWQWSASKTVTAK